MLIEINDYLKLFPNIMLCKIIRISYSVSVVCGETVIIQILKQQLFGRYIRVLCAILNRIKIPLFAEVFLV